VIALGLLASPDWGLGPEPDRPAGRPLRHLHLWLATRAFRTYQRSI
jgi:hypothetical protein